MVKFLRRDAKRYSKFGFGRGKKAKWRSPKGRDNKLREKRKGHGALVSIGYAKDKKERISFDNNKMFLVKTLKDLDKISKDQKVILGKIGKKKEIEIIKKAKEKKIEFSNVNVNSYLKKLKKKENELKK
jgi:large subunit ribosomal protein L32e